MWIYMDKHVWTFKGEWSFLEIHWTYVGMLTRCSPVYLFFTQRFCLFVSAMEPMPFFMSITEDITCFAARYLEQLAILRNVSLFFYHNAKTIAWDISKYPFLHSTALLHWKNKHELTFCVQTFY